MKKKLLILSASIALILACFPFTLYADEDPESDLGVSPPTPYYQLDGYFYENYVSYPYIESTGQQYIDTGINAKSNLRINLQFSDFNSTTGTFYLYGGGTSMSPLEDIVAFSITSNGSLANYRFDSSVNTYSNSFDPYAIYSVTQDNNICYLNNVNVHEFNESTFTSSRSISIFGKHTGNSVDMKTAYKLYSFSIYDYDLDQYVRYYYPAKSKADDSIGLYDAVSKTFFTSLSGTAFAQPSGNIASAGIVANIGNFIYYGLGWIGDILGYAITEPIIILFMAIGLAGAMFRWGRKLVHF